MTSEHRDVAGLRLLVDQGRALLDRQWDAFESQDRKISGLFGLATALVTVAPAAVTAFAADGLGVRIAPLVAAGFAYLIALVLLWRAYRPAEFRLIGDAEGYATGWTNFSEGDVLRFTLFDLALAQAENESTLAEKGREMSLAAIAVAVEAALLLAGLLTISV